MNIKTILQTVGFLIVLICCANLAYAENIDPCDDGSQYAYGENVGWFNFEPNVAGPNVGATVTDYNMTGFIWAENIGWINLDPNFGGVSNDSYRNLSGYAWGENVGWINFNPQVAGDPTHYGVTIDANGNFDGWAWGENIGWIHFQSATPVAYKVQTSWSPTTCWSAAECAGQPNGDATCNGYVNFADLFALKVNFGKCAPWTPPECCADFTQDGCINFADLFALKTGFGTSGYVPSTGNQDCPTSPDLIVPAGTSVTEDSPGDFGKFQVAGRLIVQAGADLRFASQSYIDGVPTSGIRPEIIMNGGSFHIDARLDMGTNKADNGGNDAYLTMNGGYLRVGTEASSGDSGDLKFPDDDDPIGPHRIYLNGGVLRVHRCEMYVARDAIIYVGAGIMEIEDISVGDPQDWKDQGGLLPLGGWADVVIDYDEPVPGGARVYAVH